MKSLRQKLAAIMVSVAMIIGLVPAVASAICNTNQQSCSGSYGVSETFFGSGGELNACSSSYCSKQSAGELTVGATSATAKTSTLNPIADTYVSSGSPTTNFGTADPLKASTGSYTSYLKFDTSSFQDPGLITSVQLKLYSNYTDATGKLAIHSTTDAWTETGITASNAPAVGTDTLATSRSVVNNTMIAIDLPISAITPSGNSNFAVKFTDPGKIALFASRENATNPPQLVIKYGGFQAHAGFNTNREVYLEVLVNTSSVDLGVLDPAETHVGTATFSVKTYLAQGYQVITYSPGPVNGSHTMQLMGAGNTTSSVGTEQFGINLAANDCPATAPPNTEKGGCTSGSQYSAGPQQDPDNTFSFGYAEPGYDTANQYQYNDGDVIARSDSSSGTTKYTISYLFNISNVTPAGTYTMDQDLVATSTF